ncbi:hypothetical protein [Corynebacterium mustelae]|uniref:hypothetical protein n=1 Tax=Corynebacterium mustelae TaxID=571915 RepID=UPI0013960966|nr:hypothetical protein [Corynebacterium mustelae]
MLRIGFWLKICSLRVGRECVAPKLGVSWHTARPVGVERLGVDGAEIIHRDEADVIAENARLRRDNQELRDINEQFKGCIGFFRI